MSTRILLFFKKKKKKLEKETSSTCLLGSRLNNIFQLKFRIFIKTLFSQEGNSTSVVTPTGRSVM